jgi:transglutaminase-like putative cysteine protease
MTYIPAFPDDSYVTSPKNFKSAIYFKLAEFTNPATMDVKKYIKDWAEIDADLKNASYFGKQLKRSNQVKEFIAPAIANSTTPLDKAKAIYAFVKSSIKWDGTNASGSELGVVKAFQNHTGNSGDINLALITALNAAGLNADAMLLATRDKGVINKTYATESDFNYVVAKITIDDKTYFLDATEPALAFGMLPLRCLNGEGYVLSLSTPSEWVDINPQIVQKTAFMRNVLFGQKTQNLF